MPWSIDARIPVRIGGGVGDGDIAFVEGEHFEPDASHAPACACCAGRSPAATALGRLFEQRARAELPFFRRVVVRTSTVAGEAAISAALRDDPVAASRFRPEA